jgi:hypothetical protein
MVEDRDVFEATLQAQIEILKRFHENTDTIIVEAHEETRSRIFEAIVESDTTSERRQETAQRGVERLHATMVQFREEIKEQNAAIERLRLERVREQSLEGQRALQERLNAEYAALLKLAIAYAALQVGHPYILHNT